MRIHVKKKMTDRAKKFPATLGGRIRQLRGDLTQAEFAQMLQIKQAMVSRYEADKETPSPPVLLRLAQFSNRSMEWLLTGKEETPAAAEAPARRLAAKVSKKLGRADLLAAAADYLRDTRHPQAREFIALMEAAFNDPKLMQKLLDYFQYLKFQGRP